MTATFHVAAARLVVVFDRRLVAGSLDHNNWRIRHNSLRRLGDANASAIAQSIRCHMGAGVLAMGPDIVDYLPPPFDVIAWHGPAVAGFTDFPLATAP